MDRTAKPGQPAPLTEEQVTRIAENRALIHEHAPEILPTIKKMADLGMIEGWRNVDEVMLKSDATD